MNSPSEISKPTVAYPNEYEAKLQARIRELEAADKVHWKTRRSLLASIAKAKAIITGPGQMAYDETEYAMILNRILAALDGLLEGK